MAGVILTVTAALFILSASTSILLIAVDEVTGGEFGRVLVERMRGGGRGGR